MDQMFPINQFYNIFICNVQIHFQWLWSYRWFECYSDRNKKATSSHKGLFAHVVVMFIEPITRTIHINQH